MTEALREYCSWCFEKTSHKLIEQNYLRRNVYQCESCKNKTLQCRYCSSMAKQGEFWDDELCAEHDGSIASFKTASSTLSDISAYHEILKRERINLAKVAKIAAGTAGGAVLFGPLAFIAGPSVAAALGTTGLLGAAGTGTAISSLSGAALTSASVAAIGGGTMMAGAAILTAAGGMLGGANGAAISNTYFGEISNFQIRKIEEGNKHSVIFINGFMSENDHDVSDWTAHLEKHFNKNTKYHVNWESKNLKKLGSIAAGAPHKAGMELAKALAKRALKEAPAKIAPFALLGNITDLIGNPWHATMLKAGMTGVMLADAIARTPGWTFTLAGHSLGARVIYYALEALSTKSGKPIQDVYLLGGAVGGSSKDSPGWESATNVVRGRIYNCHSNNDGILKVLYRGANGFQSEPIGYSPIQLKHEKIHNFDCTELVDGHTSWKHWFGEILDQLKA